MNEKRKAFLEKKQKRLEEKREALKNKALASTDAAEVRSINEQISDINDELTEIRDEMATFTENEERQLPPQMHSLSTAALLVLSMLPHPPIRQEKMLTRLPRWNIVRRS